MKKSKTLTVIDFFCGAGGFSEGFRQEGYKIIMGIDNWLPAIRTHNLNHRLNDTTSDVLKFGLSIEAINSLPNSDVIVGSPPCVSFSLSNKGGGADKSVGLRLIESYLRVIAVKKHQPNSILKAWLMENVPNSRNYVKEAYSFEDLNLKEWALQNSLLPTSLAINVKNSGGIFDASDFGAAQSRKRFLCGEVVPSGFFPYPNTVHTKKSLINVLEHLPAPLTRTSNRKINDPNYNVLTLRNNELVDHHYDTGVYEVEWRKALAAKQNHPYMGKMSFPENITRPSRTLMATRSASTREALLYPSEIKRSGNGQYRLPTVREAASIMGFPITYIFVGNESTKWRQIGNAVCPQLAYELAREIKRQLGYKLEEKRLFFAPQANDTTITLDDYQERNFSKPPKRSGRAVFRNHPLKSGNMTVALTNTHPITKEKKWLTVAFVGTGKGYKTVVSNKQIAQEARKFVERHSPEFANTLDEDAHIRFMQNEHLDRLHNDFHFNDEVGEHPLSLVTRIKNHIDQHLKDDVSIPVDGLLRTIKPNIPLSQLMALSAVSKITISELI